MQDRPTKQELLRIIETFLRAEIMPVTAGRDRFHLLVATNLLSILQRELDLEEEQATAELGRLKSLLGGALPPAPPGSGSRTQQLRAAKVGLCEEIRSGAFSAPEARRSLCRHLRATLEDQLAVANPDFLRRVQSRD